MRSNIDYKVPNGKLLRIQAEVVNDILRNIKITGDFFIHPETAIEDIEDLIKGSKIEKIEEKIEDYIKTENIEIVGFQAKDLVEVIKKI